MTLLTSLKRLIKRLYIPAVVLPVATGILLLPVLVAAQFSSKENNAAEAGKPLTVTYSLQVKTARQKGLAESYDGSIKAIFMQEGKVRSRLVALMRIQSLFYFPSVSGNADSIISVKETGKERIVTAFTNSEWNHLQRKYNAAKTVFYNDSLTLLNYTCKKAIVFLQDGKTITAYYSSKLQHPLFKLAEPAFAGIPGIVLQYEYATGNTVLLYKATQVSFSLIDPQVFRVPAAK